MTGAAATRCWLLTPPSAGAIGVVRIQGPQAPHIVESVFTPASASTPNAGSAPCAWATNLGKRVRYGRVVDGGDVLDTAVVSLAQGADGPAFDLCVHGGVRIIERTLELIQRHGADLATAPLHAWPARTWMEQEALSVLISAKTERAVRFLAWQSGHLAEHLRDLAARAASEVAAVRLGWTALIAASEAALPLVAGAKVALVGPPNGGKSTIFNRLVGREAAVATPFAGTTRDWVSAEVDLSGVAVTLIDTAGCRHAPESSEQDAIAAGRASAESADVVVIVVDGTTPTNDAVATVTSWAGMNHRAIVAINKSDLPQRLDITTLGRTLGGAESAALSVSARLGTGFDQLTDGIVQRLGVPPEDGDRRPAFFSKQQLDVARSLVPILKNDPADFARRVLAGFVRSTWDCSISAEI